MATPTNMKENNSPDTNITELSEANAHLACNKKKRNKQFSSFLLENDLDIEQDIINLEITYFSIRNGCNLLKRIARNNGKILFLSGSIHLHKLIKKYTAINMQNYMLKWSGGLLTNFSSILKSKNIAFKDPTKDTSLSNAALLSRQKKNAKLQEKYEGIKNLTELPKAVVVFNPKNYKQAIAEARAKGILTIAIIDSNTKPFADYNIPLNVNSLLANEIVLRCFSKSILEGLQHAFKSQSRNDNHNTRTTTNNTRKNYVKPLQISNKTATK
ncbi:MAG: 30S ribosomal protein S2 [Pseudomonadota bacterium]